MADMNVVEQRLQQILTQRLTADPGLVKDFQGLVAQQGGEIAKQWLDYGLRQKSADSAQPDPHQISGEVAPSAAVEIADNSDAEDAEPDEIGILISADEVEAILCGDIPADLAAELEAAEWEITTLELVD